MYSPISANDIISTVYPKTYEQTSYTWKVTLLWMELVLKSTNHYILVVLKQINQNIKQMKH